jgi:hypothetical protein
VPFTPKFDPKNIVFVFDCVPVTSRAFDVFEAEFMPTFPELLIPATDDDINPIEPRPLTVETMLPVLTYVAVPRPATVESRLGLLIYVAVPRPATVESRLGLLIYVAVPRPATVESRLGLLIYVAVPRPATVDTIFSDVIPDPPDPPEPPILLIFSPFIKRNAEESCKFFI